MTDQGRLASILLNLGLILFFLVVLFASGGMP
jgi:hypothetical protein